jgi:hypothetical protein
LLAACSDNDGSAAIDDEIMSLVSDAGLTGDTNSEALRLNAIDNTGVFL